MPPAAAIVDARDRPANVDAERAVLGSILLKPDVCDDVALVVRPEDFADEAYQLLYRHLVELHDSGKRIDVTIVLERLRTKGDLCRTQPTRPITPRSFATRRCSVR
jgi:replicative DNA helicase